LVYLLFVSLIWAFSFGLIKGNLTGVDSNFVAFARLGLSLLVFLPFLRARKITGKVKWKLILTGLLQFGVMYIAYLAAFRYLKAYEVALFTIFTPIFVTLLDDILGKRFNLLHLVVAILTVIGTWVVEQGSTETPGIWLGFLLVQVSNLAYAFGQVYYRRIMADKPELKDHEVFGFLYLGGALITAIATLLLVPLKTISLDPKQIWTLVYLGIVASGIGFFLWNFGARKVNTGTLAIFNDLKIPLAVAVSLLVFNEQADLPSLLIGGAIIIAALIVNEVFSRKQSRVSK
jgi:carboxylate/amino acid/amine transporter